jgi:hypothetical protein
MKKKQVFNKISNLKELMNMEGQKIIICSNCGSNRIRVGMNIYKFAVIASSITVIGIIFVPFIYLIYLSQKKKLKGNRQVRCISCFRSFKIPNTKYYDYKKEVNKINL